jgi:HEAT repeat protein
MSLREEVAGLIADLHGSEAASALCNLTSMPETLPFVVAAYQEEPNARRRESLIHCLWQYRDLAALPTLRAAMRDSDDRVWKEALDGLVALGGDEAQRVLREALLELPDGIAARTQRKWIDEALEQIEETNVSNREHR